VLFLVVTVSGPNIIDKLIEKSSKQLNILSKLKFKLKRNNLEKNYLTFIRSILDMRLKFGLTVAKFNSNRLEKVQIEAAGWYC